jgi:hypothetical protein
MSDPSKDDCITVRVIYTPGFMDRVASVFIKREGRDPTGQEVRDELRRQRAAENPVYAELEKRLLEEVGMEPDVEDVSTTLETQQRDPKHNSDCTARHQDLAWPTTKKSLHPTSRSNPVDLTRSVQSGTDLLTKSQKTGLRQTNVGAARFCPQFTTQTTFLSTISQAEHRSDLERTSTQPTEILPKIQLHTNFTSQMSEPDRRKVKAVARKPAISKSSDGDVGPRPTTEAAAKAVTKASSRSLTKQHAGKFLEDSNDDYITRRRFGQYLSATESSKHASTTGKPQDLAQSSFAKEDSFAAVLFDKDEPRDTTSRSSQPLPSCTPTIIGKPVFMRPQPKSPPTSSRPLASATITHQALDDHVPTVSSSQCKPFDLFFLLAEC